MPPKLTTVGKVPLSPGAIPVATRLKPFGLAATKLQLTNNLEVAANQTVTLDAADEKLGKQVTRLTPKTIDDVKAWIGVPDAAFAQIPAPITHSVAIIPVQDSYTDQQTTILHAAAQDYIFGHSAAVSQTQIPALNAWLGSIAGSLSVIFFQDIHVAVNAKLVLNPSITILFARYITIDQGGVIRVGCRYGGINCAGIKGATPRIILNPVRLPV